MRVSVRPIARYPWYLAPFFWKQKRKYGQVLVPGLLWGSILLTVHMNIRFRLTRRGRQCAPPIRSHW